MMKRPTINNLATVSTPYAASIVSLLGSDLVAGGVCVTKTEYNNLKKLYGFEAEEPNEKPPAPEPPKREDFGSTWDYEAAMRKHEAAVKAYETWKDPQQLHQAGADRNLVRHAECDGMRMIAWLAKYVPAGQDPMKILIQMAIDSGFDVYPEDVDYAENEEIEDEDE